MSNLLKVLFTHYIPKVFFITSDENAHLNTNLVAKNNPNRRSIRRPKVVQRKSERIHTKQPSINVEKKITKEATYSTLVQEIFIDSSNNYSKIVNQRFNEDNIGYQNPPNQQPPIIIEEEFIALLSDDEILRKVMSSKENKDKFIKFLMDYQLRKRHMQFMTLKMKKW